MICPIHLIVVSGVRLTDTNKIGHFFCINYRHVVNIMCYVTLNVLTVLLTCWKQMFLAQPQHYSLHFNAKREANGIMRTIHELPWTY